MRGVVACAVLAAAVVSSAGCAQSPPPVSEKVADYYSAMPTSPVINGSLTVKRPASGPLKIVFAGDSLTYGLFASTESKGYRPQVVDALGKSGPVEFSRGGHTGNRIKQVSDSITFPADTNMVVLALGTNDVWKTDVADAAAHYKALVRKVTTSVPNTPFACLGVWSNVDGARNYDPVIQSACEAGGGKFIRLTDIFETEGSRGPAGRASFGGISDKFHPNDAGYKAISDRLLSFVSVE